MIWNSAILYYVFMALLTVTLILWAILAFREEPAQEPPKESRESKGDTTTGA